MTTESTVLILGASRGLGLAMAEEWLKRDAKVIATQRSASRDLSELQGRYPASLEIETVDIVAAASVHALRERLGARRIDVLFVNAGICKAHEETLSTVDERDFVDMLLTNAFGPMRAVELFENLVPASGAIAVMTSELGSITENRGFWELYSSSKAALNMLMKCFWSRQAGSAPTWGPRPQRSRSKKASRSSWKPASAVAAGPACASSTATVEPCPGDSKANGRTHGHDHHSRRQHPAPWLWHVPHAGRRLPAWRRKRARARLSPSRHGRHVRKRGRPRRCDCRLERPPRRALRHHQGLARPARDRRLNPPCFRHQRREAEARLRRSLHGPLAFEGHEHGDRHGDADSAPWLR